MLSVRLPETLALRLDDYCVSMGVSKSLAVQTALEKHLKKAVPARAPKPSNNPFLALLGTGNGQLSTEQVMRMTRGDDWNAP